MEINWDLTPVTLNNTWTNRSSLAPGGSFIFFCGYVMCHVGSRERSSVKMRVFGANNSEILGLESWNFDQKQDWKRKILLKIENLGEGAHEHRIDGKLKLVGYGVLTDLKKGSAPPYRK